MIFLILFLAESNQFFCVIGLLLSLTFKIFGHPEHLLHQKVMMSLGLGVAISALDFLADHSPQH